MYIPTSVIWRYLVVSGWSDGIRSIHNEEETIQQDISVLLFTDIILFRYLVEEDTRRFLTFHELDLCRLCQNTEEQ